MYYPRSIEQTILSASRQFPALCLTGPRQVGKTTLLKYLGKERQYVSLDDLSIRETARRDPVLFLQRYRIPLIIDEIQYAPELLPYLKIEIDSNRRPGMYWLTGSQQFHLMRNITESLAGRIAIIQLHGFSHRERIFKAVSSQPFTGKITETEKDVIPVLTHDTMFHQIHLGDFPALCSGEISDRDLFYSSYLQTYIERDVRDLTQVGNLHTFMTFFRACAARNAQLINFSDLARDTDISVPTAKQWLSLLETGHQVYLLRPYHSNLTKRLVKTPKLYFHDTGLCAYLAGWTTPEALARGNMAGAYFENHVFNEITKSWWNAGKEPPIYFYRNKDMQEMDFILEMNGMLHPVEVKLGASPKREWMTGFIHLEKQGYPLGQGTIISLHPETIPLSDKVQVINIGRL